MKLHISKLLGLNLLLALTLGGCGDSNETTQPVVKTQKTLFAVYMMGSNLETNGAAGSSDLLEMLAGYYDGLNEEQQKNIDIKVAFGGSEATNWSGVKYADAACLAEDWKKDETFGDADCYTYQDENANMSSPESLTNFINSLSLSTNAYDKTIFTFWNHGGAYDGVCYPDNGEDKLTLDDLDTSLSQTSSSFDIIGMDACLMGNLEVAKTLSKYGTYLIASEELEPGHGWDYTALLKWLGENPNATLDNVPKIFVDSYMDSPEHNDTEDKTLSVVDLKKIDAFVSSFNVMLSSLDSTDDYQFILDSALASQQYALMAKEMPIGSSMDLKKFLQNLKLHRADLAEKIDTLNGMIDDFVLYNRFQDSKINSNGISVFQPLNTIEWNSIYKTKEDFLSEDWYSLVGGFLTRGMGDVIDPVKSSETNCTRDNMDGYCMDVTDNIGVAYAEAYTLLPYGEDYFLLGSDKLSQTKDEYFMSKKDDDWLYFCNGDSDECIMPSAIFVRNYDNKSLYSTFADVNGIYSEFYISVNNSDGSIDYWSVPEGNNGMESKKQKNIEKGDKLRFRYYIISTSGENHWTTADDNATEITFTNTPTVSIKSIGKEVTYFASFRDFAGNSVASEFYTTPAN